jgi:hypothetical protein
MAFSLDKLLEEEVTFETGIKGKKILLYGCNDVGKTKQMSKMPKPFLIMTEAGGSAIHCPKESCDDWRHFKEIIDDLTNSKNLEKRRTQVETVIIDTAENLVAQSERSVCNQFGVRDLSEIQGRQNGYKIARTDFELQINKLTSKGFCVVFIAHEERVEIEDEVSGEAYTFVQPKGTSNEKSSMRMLRDLTDFCIYLRPNGIDKETYKTIPSTAICRRTKNVFARSRFDIDTFIDPFTAEGLIKAIEDAVEKSAKEENVEISDYVEKKRKYTKDDYVEIITPYIQRLWDVCPDDVTGIIEAQLGEGRKISEATDDEMVALDNIYNNLVTKATLLGIEL